MTSDQQIDFTPSANINNTSIQIPSQFNGHQFIVNSDRLIFNSKLQQILMFAKKYLYLSAEQSIHINSNNQIVLHSDNILLTKQADQQAVLGNKLEQLLGNVLDKMQDMETKISNLQSHSHTVATFGPSSLPVIIPNPAAQTVIINNYNNYRRRAQETLSNRIKLK